MAAKGGISTQTGTSYQNYVGVLRVLEFSSNTSLVKLEFESRGGALEDINIFYTSHVILEQTKWKGFNDWTPSEIRPVLGGFCRKLERIGDSPMSKFRFSTNRQGNRELTDFEAILPRIRGTETLKDLKDADRELMAVVFPKGTDEQTMFAVSRMLEFDWNLGASNPLTPLIGIRNKCVSELENRCSYSQVQAESMVQRLFEEVCRWATLQTEERCYPLERFRDAIPDCGRVDVAAVATLIPANLLEVIMAYKPDRLFRPGKMKLGNESVETQVYASIRSCNLLIWVIDKGVLPGRIEKVNRLVKAKYGYHHIVILLDEGVDVRFFSDEVQGYVIRPADVDRLSRILEDLIAHG